MCCVPLAFAPVFRSVVPMGEHRWSDAAAVVALAGLPKMGPRRLRNLLSDRTPIEAVEWVGAGGLPDGVPAPLGAAWRAGLHCFDPDAARTQLRESGTEATWSALPTHPTFLADDVAPAPVLFRRGRPIDEAAPAVAIVGTRRASGTGREIARELGLGLAEAGVTVVSGLALGIDGAAHEGALLADAAPPVAFVGGGTDVVYPKRHLGLWGRMVDAGTVAGEAPPAAPPAPWRFPARNRLIAAAADIVVVVESRAAGGSLLTVDEAIRRDRQVMAVPGSLRNPAAAGTNSLLADGCAPVLAVDDVLTALGLSQVERETRRDRIEVPPAPSAAAARVLSACDDGPASIDRLSARSGLAVGEVLAAVSELLVAGAVVDDGARVRRA